MLEWTVGEGARTRPLEVGDATEFAAHLDRARDSLRPWVGPSFLRAGVDGARTTLSRYDPALGDEGRRLVGIWWRDRLVGGVMVVSASPATLSCELGCWLEPTAEGRGFVTRAASALLDHVFLDRGLHRAEWRCRADNVRSAAVARRLGMRLEGTLRSAWRYDGAWYDTQVWGLLATDPRP